MVIQHLEGGVALVHVGPEDLRPAMAETELQAARTIDGPEAIEVPVHPFPRPDALVEVRAAETADMSARYSRIAADWQSSRPFRLSTRRGTCP